MSLIYWHVASNKANSAIAHTLSILQGCVRPAPGRQHASPNAELESQKVQRETQAGIHSQCEEQSMANSMDNSKLSLRIKATVHS
jgi:osmotically-inducible protein OsmY